MSPPPSHEPEIQASRSSEESEQLRNLMDIVPRLESRVKSLEKELSETKQTLGTAILQLIEKVKKLENKLRKKRKSKEAKDAEGQDQEVPFETDQGDTFVTPEKSKGSGEAQEEQISPSTLEAAQILTNVASEGFKDHKHLLGSKIYKRNQSLQKTPTNFVIFEEPDSAQVNTAQVNTGELNPASTPSAQINTGEVNTAAVNTGEAERVQRRKGKEPMTEEDLQAEVQASRHPKGFTNFLAGTMGAVQKQATNNISARNQMITYLKHVANKKHAELKSKSFEEIQVFYLRSIVMEEYKDWLPEGFDRDAFGEIDDYEVLSQMLEVKLETEEESSMALELIKFVRQQLEEFEDSNDDDAVHYAGR
ncbi:hypothetical protein Tco_0666262 [Tanacetum coccineum]